MPTVRAPKARMGRLVLRERMAATKRIATLRSICVGETNRECTRDGVKRKTAYRSPGRQNPKVVLFMT